MLIDKDTKTLKGNFYKYRLVHSFSQSFYLLMVEGPPLIIFRFSLQSQEANQLESDC